jgi:hypothetical protein
MRERKRKESENKSISFAFKVHFIQTFGGEWMVKLKKIFTFCRFYVL